MDRDDLVERVENSIIATIRRITGCPRGACDRPGGCDGDYCDEAAMLAAHISRATIAIIEPVVREDERRRCAALVMGWVPWRSDINPHLAAAIRAGAKL